MAVNKIKRYDDGGDVPSVGDDWGDGNSGSGYDISDPGFYMDTPPSDAESGGSGSGTGSVGGDINGGDMGPGAFSGIDFINKINKALGTKMSGTDLLKYLAIGGGGVAGLMGANKPNITKVGYQGGIPQLQANRNMMLAPPTKAQGYRPGQGGVNYGGDVVYSPKGTAADAPGGSYTPPADHTGSNMLPFLGGLGGIGALAQYMKNRPQTSDGQQDSQPIAAPPTNLSPPPQMTTPTGWQYDNSKDDNFLPPIRGYQPQIMPKEQTAPAQSSFDLKSLGNLSPEQMAQVQQLMAQKNIQAPTVKAAQGGIMGLAHGGRYLQGDTDGMADKLPTSIDGKQPAALSHGEFVIPADVVSHLGNGNSDAGAKKLYSMMDKIRQARTGTKKQGKQINPDKFMPGGLAYAAGGSVRHFATGDSVPAGTTGVEQTLAGWTGDYIPNMLAQGQALANAPYQQYQGPLTAGASDLQNKAFNTASNLSVPGSVGTAAQTAGDIATKAQNTSYAPTTFTNQFNAPAAGTATNFTNQYQAPTPYQNTNFTSGTFGNEQAQQYMNPYLQQSLNPQLAEARRQSDITAAQNNAAMTKAGAFGGGRQAILTGENQRNLGTNLANITGQGYNTAFTNAMSQYNADQARNLQAQQASEQSKQFGAQQGMTAAQLMAQYGLSAQQAQEAARQFQQSQAMTGAQSAAQYGQAAQQAAEQSKQFGANLGLQGLQTGLQAAQTQGNLGIAGGQLGLQQLQEQANLGNTQRGIEAEGIAADKKAFEEARDNPYKMLQFQQSLLNGLPISATNYQQAGTSGLTDAAGGATTVDTLLSKLIPGYAPTAQTPPK
jgi:hypothetical protein